MNVPHQLKTFLDDVLLKAIGDMGDGVLLLEESRIVYANEAFCRIVGLSESQVLETHSFFDLIPAESRGSLQEKILSHPSGRKIAGRFETDLQPKGHKKAHVELTVTSVHGEKPPRWVYLVRDLSEPQTLKETLQRQDAEYRVLFQDHPSPMIIYDLNGLSILEVNEAAVLKYGYDRKEFLKLTFKDLRDPEDLPDFLSKVDQLREGMSVVKETVKHRLKDGSLMDAELMSHPLKFEGRKARMVMVFDLTIRRRAESALLQSQQHLQNVMSTAPIILFAVDRNGLITLVEGSGLETLGLRSKDLLGKSAFELYRHNPAVIHSLRRALAGEEHVTSIEESGQTFEARFTPVRDAKDQVVSTIGTAINVTERQKMGEVARFNEEKFRELFNNAIDPMFLFEVSDEGLPGKFVEVNDIACVKLGYTREELHQRTPFDIASPEDAADLTKTFKRLLQQKHLSYEKTYFTKTGLKIPVEINSHVFQWDGRRIVQSIARDITERKRADETIRRQAYYDVLTNLPNRMLFKDRLEQAMKQAHRNNQKVGVIVLDLDRFKNINETLGHLLGDKLLVAVAERLLTILGESETIARFGGDEFTLLLPQVSSVEEATLHCQKIIELLGAPFKLNNHELHVTTSIGLAFYPEDGENSEVLLKNAETAMYRAKEQGRNNYQLYASVMNVSAFKQLLMENSLRRGLEREEFVVYYQPQIDLKTRKIIGAEALVRWKHPDLGLVFPTEFIGLAEDTGLIVPIGEWVIRQVCSQSKKWQEAGLEKICVSVNLSARQFQQRNLVATIESILQETGLDPQWLGLEITESIAMKNADFTIAALNEFRKMGIHLSLDDFGTGYSSLSYLKRFPLETLKIDRSFVRDITTDPNDAAIVTAVVALAHSLKLSVVAEGVETEGQLSFLKTHSCDHVQGYIFSHPLSEENFLKVLKDTSRT